MFFEYPRLLWLLVVPALLVLRYLYVEIRDRRPHLRVSNVRPWKSGGRSVLGVVRHIPFVLRIAALSLIVVAIARPRSSTKIEKVSTSFLRWMSPPVCWRGTSRRTGSAPPRT